MFFLDELPPLASAGLLAAGLAALALAGTRLLAVRARLARARGEIEQFRLKLEQMVEDETDELARAHQRLRSEANERRLVVEAMRMLERAVEQSIDGVAVTDLAGGTHFLNEAWARMHGYEVCEVLGYDLTLFHSHEQMQEQVFPLMTQVRQRGSFRGEVWHRRKDGTEFPTWMSVTRVEDPHEGPVGMVAIARDVSERRKASEEQLRLEVRAQQAERLESLAVLAAGIAHDYNNLLTAVLGNIDLVLRELPADSLARGKIRQIETAAERAATLSDQLLAYAGEERLALQRVEVNALVEAARAELAGEMPANARLELQLNPGLPAVDADPVQVRQVIRKLVENSREALGGEAGVVTLRTSFVDARREYFENAVLDEGQPEGRYAIFEVSDSGCGIDEKTRARIFDPFFSTKGAGRGLGLATALGIVRAHHGAIKVHSEPTRGTTVEVLLPASLQPGAVDVVEKEVLETWRGTGTVLVVDDELLVREVAKDILEHHGFEVLSAADGGEAMEIYRRRGDRIRLVLLDLTMPGMSGAEVLAEIRRLDREAVVLLMSGYSQNRVRGEGFAGFLHKPFRPEDLVRKVREVTTDRRRGG